MTNLDSIFKSRDITLPTKVCLVKAMVFPVVVYGCESEDCEQGWALKNWCFWSVVLDIENDTFHLSTENASNFPKEIPKIWDYEIMPWLQTLGCCSWELIVFLSTDESFNIGLKFEIAFEVRPRSSSGTLVHGHSVNGEYLNVHMKNGQVVCYKLF